MPPKQTHARLVEKATAAMVAAIEIYNKPTFDYREETFCLLALNAWEILLKARIIQSNGGDFRRVYVYETRETKAGKKSRKKYIRRTESGSPRTISLHDSIHALDRGTECKLPETVKANLTALSAVRDASAHYVTPSSVLQAQVLRIAAATVKNFVVITKKWFESDLSQSISLILPLAFLYPDKLVDSVTVSASESNLINYLRKIAESSCSEGDCEVALNVEVKLKRSNLESATKVQIVNDPSATQVVLTEENMLARYRWNYSDLTTELKKRYADFRENARYHSLRKGLSSDSRFTWRRHQNPKKPSGATQHFFCEAILGEFDKHYTRRATSTHTPS